MPNTSDEGKQERPQQPLSLGDHVVAEDRADLIRAHIAMLSGTALEISDALAFSADTSDFLRILDDEAEQ